MDANFEVCLMIKLEALKISWLLKLMELAIYDEVIEVFFKGLLYKFPKLL